MKNMKRLLWVLATLALLACLTCFAFAEETPTSGTCGEHVTWSYDKTMQTLTISGTGEMEVENGYGVMNPWSGVESQMKTVLIESGVTSICRFAFVRCTAISKVTIPNSVTKIGFGAFNGCKSLVNVTIPDSVSSIESSAFEGTPFYSNLFKNESNWDNGVLYIGNILMKAKEDLSGKYTVRSGIKTIAAEAFRDCKSLTEVVIPDSVMTIEASAFSGCEALNTISIPDSVTSISASSFYNTGYYNNDSNWQDHALYIGKCLITATVDISESYTIRAGTRIIAENAFADGLHLTNVTIPSSVTNIGNDAFSFCSSLKTVSIPNSVIRIGDSAFYGCQSLTSVTISNGVKSIGNGAFSYCTSLTDISIPDSVVDFGNSVFDCCVKLRKKTTIHFHAGNGISIPDYSLVSNTPLDYYALPSPLKAGYILDGWYTAASGGTKCTHDMKFKTDTTLYAHWVTAVEPDFSTMVSSFADVLTNKSKTIAIAKTDIEIQGLVHYFYTKDGLNYKYLELSSFIPSGYDFSSEEIYVEGDTFIICLDAFKNNLELSGGQYSNHKVSTSHVLLTSTDLQHFEKHTLPENDSISNVLRLDNGTYIVQYSYDKKYYYTTNDFNSFQKHQIPTTNYAYAICEAAGNSLLLIFPYVREGGGLGDGGIANVPTQFGQQAYSAEEIYSTKDFDKYTNITPSKASETYEFGGTSCFVSESKDCLFTVSTYRSEYKASGYDYLYSFSKVNITTGKETLLRKDVLKPGATNERDDGFIWTTLGLYDKVIYFYYPDNKTYIYDVPTGSFGEGVCSYRVLLPNDTKSFTEIDDERALGVNGKDNKLYLFNPTRLDQIKSFDVSKYGFETGGDNVYYTYMIGKDCYMVATHFGERKVSKLDLDLSWDQPTTPTEPTTPTTPTEPTTPTPTEPTTPTTPTEPTTPTQPTQPTQPTTQHQHTYVTTVTPAKYHKAGKTVQTCTACGAKVSVKIPAVQSITLSATKYTYNGKRKTPTVEIYDSNGDELVRDLDYTLQYSKGRKEIGSYKVKITFTGDYTGTKTRTFQIVPGKVKGLKASAGKNAAQLNWKAVKGATNYIVYCTDSKNGTYKKLFTTQSTTAKVMKLKSNRTYYFRVRAVAKLDSGNYKGAASAVRSVKVK